MMEVSHLFMMMVNVLFYYCKGQKCPQRVSFILEKCMVDYIYSIPPVQIIQR